MGGRGEGGGGSGQRQSGGGLRLIASLKRAKWWRFFRYWARSIRSEDEKGWIERFLDLPITHETVLRTKKDTYVNGTHIHDMLFNGQMTEGYVIDAYFDLLDKRIKDGKMKKNDRYLGKIFDRSGEEQEKKRALFGKKEGR
ncbi:hypothetical protein QJS10_CPB12g00883 [Acorus calamus]|uniref:Uncharacterized protein n=1 Tax=Acorus calamus TaxID=4465 RepID=A0AAV9DPB5_ACOCL|nr:hypothetical protein QJS10_CPB12g00883 [Acorus calamus]